MIKEDEELLIEPRLETIRVGDVVVYRLRGRFIAHRVVRTWRSGGRELFLLKGDRSTSFDPPLARESICGRVSGKVAVSRFTDYNSQSWLYLNALIAMCSYAVGRGIGLYRKR